MKTYLHDLSQKLFNNLKSDEVLGLKLHSEDSQFYRFSQSKVRQNTFVSQHELTLILQKQKRQISFTLNLTLDLQTDLESTTQTLRLFQDQILQIDENPFMVTLQNHGHSETFKKNIYTDTTKIPEIISQVFSNCDLAGLWASGPLRSASINSMGQFHYFESDFFFFDYSVYDGPRAAKGYYSSEKWSIDEFQKSAQATLNKLNLLKKEPRTIPPGQYKVFLEPMAVAEIIAHLNWSSFSMQAYKQGRSMLKKLKDDEVQLSTSFYLSENLGLGYSPLFNEAGEVSRPQVEIIRAGKLIHLLTSSTTATQHKLESHFCENSESPKSIEIRAGTLNQSEALKKLGTGLYLSNLHYINMSDMLSARITGMTRYACFWVENGEIVAPIKDLRFDESIFNIFGSELIELTDESSLFINTDTYMRRYPGGMKVPGALINNFSFTL